MKYKSNPFSTAFGSVPPLFLSMPENNIVTNLVERLNANPVTENVFMLTGIRGSGKTVALTAIEEEIEKDNSWIVIDLNSQNDLLLDLVAKLYDTQEFISKFIMAELNLSAFGIGINASAVPPVASIETAFIKILDEIKKKNKKLLIAIDEASKTDSMLKFAGSFNLASRKKYPVYLLMTGLLNNFSTLEDAKDMTFLRRACKLELEPLNYTLVSQKYKEVFEIGLEKAAELTALTKGYPYAYQVLGKILWEKGEIELSEDVLSEFDLYMDTNVYNKIWRSLTNTEQWYVCHLSIKDDMKVAELLEMTAKKANDFSRFRESLREKGVIDTSKYGHISFYLPRFKEFVIRQMLLEGRRPDNNYGM